METSRFCGSGIRRLVLPASVKTVQSFAFSNCEALEYADLSAVRGPKTLERFAFSSCKRLSTLLLKEGIRKLGWLFSGGLQ